MSAQDKSRILSLLQDKSCTKDPLWCPGCGDFTELAALKQALAELAAEDIDIHKDAVLETIPECEELGIDSKICRSCGKPHYYPRYEPHKLVMDSGIGCSGQRLAYIALNRIKAPHGRVLPISLGLKAARPDLTVIPQGGDGDAFAIGGCHFVNFPGFNMDVTYMVTNNEVYSLTKGQVSPSSQEWIKTAANPNGPARTPINPIALGLSAGWSFVARLAMVKTVEGFDTRKLCIDTLKAAIAHPGASLVIFETECPSYNKFKTKEWLAERVKPMPDGHDAGSLEAALKLSLVPEDEMIPVGVYFRQVRPTYHERFGIEKPLIGRGPSVEQLDKLMDQFS